MANTQQATRYDLSGEDDAEAIQMCLHSLAERLEAASNFIEAIRARGHELPALDTGRATHLEKAARQLDLAVQEFRQLRDRLRRG
jgi:hypothetical protein